MSVCCGKLAKDFDIEHNIDDYAEQAIDTDLNIETIFEEKTPKRNAYLLITLYRSGSTLTGEMFNRNLDFLYFFEPLGKIEIFDWNYAKQ